MYKNQNWKNIKRNCTRRNSVTCKPNTLSVLYKTWTKLPNEEKLLYRSLSGEFNKNFVSIKNILKPKVPLLKVVNPGNSRPIDMRQKYENYCEELKIKNTKPIQGFIQSLKKLVSSSSTTKFANKRTLVSSLKTSILENYLVCDEPVQNIKDISMSKIPFKIFLSSNNIHGEIFISGLKEASELTLLRKNDIKAILHIGDTEKLTKFVTISGGYLNIPIKETENDLINFKEFYLKGLRFIESRIREGNVLVTCHYGVCRSPTIVIAYLMRKFRIKLEKAHEIVRAGRKSINLSKAAQEILSELDSF